MKGMKRLCALALCIVMALTLMPATAFAVDTITDRSMTRNTPPETLRVNGTDILKEASHKVTCGDGTAEYDADSNTLTLTNATIEGDFTGAAAININGGDVTIRLVGTNTITSGTYGVYMHGTNTVTVGGSGTLTINASLDCIRATNITIGIADEADAPTINATGQDNASGLYATHVLTIQNGATVNAASEGSYAMFAEGGLVIDGSTVSASAAVEYYAAIGSVTTVNISNSAVNASAKAGIAIASYGASVSIFDSVVKAESPDTQYSVYGATGGSLSGTWLDSTNPYVLDSIKNSATNSAVILKGSGTVIGNLTLARDAELRTGVTLDIPENTSLTVPDGVTFYNNGTVTLNGTFTNSGITICAEGSHTGGAATCAAAAACALCGNAYGEADPTNHKNLVKTEAKPATYSEEGNIEYWYCSDCGKYFSDEAGTREITLEETVIPKLTRPSSGPSTYAPTITDSENGDTTVTPSRPSAGQTVTIKPEPDEGYEVDKITVTDRNGSEIAVTDNGDGTYSFRQPSGSVTIIVTYAEDVCDGTDADNCPLLAFDDLDPSEWYHEYVEYAIENGLMEGMGDNKFSPETPVTRAQVVTVLWRLENEPVVNYAMTFEDVPESQWYTEAIRWAASIKVVLGHSDAEYGTDEYISRQDMATILYRYASYKGYNVSASDDLDFTDADDIKDYALAAMRWVCGAGIYEGNGNGTVNPLGDTRRCEYATLMMRFIEGFVTQ